MQTREQPPKIVAVRQEPKDKVFVRTALRALKRVAPAGNIRLISFVVLVGGSALDLEIPRKLSDALIEYGVVTGQAKGHRILLESLQARQGWLGDMAGTLSASDKEQIIAALNILIDKANRLEQTPEPGR